MEAAVFRRDRREMAPASQRLLHGGRRRHRTPACGGLFRHAALPFSGCLNSKGFAPAAMLSSDLQSTFSVMLLRIIKTLQLRPDVARYRFRHYLSSASPPDSSAERVQAFVCI